MSGFYTEGNKFLYSDFTNSYVGHTFRPKKSDGITSEVEPERLSDLLLEVKNCVSSGYPDSEITTISPSDLFPKFNYKHNCHMRGKFVVPQPAGATLKYDVILHARNRTFSDDRNWGINNWNELCAKLRGLGLKLGAVGRNDSLLPRGCDDLRGCDIESTCRYYRHSDLVIGESSGPMHLAMLCNKPIVVWWTGKTENINKNRYDVNWNFHGSPVITIGEYGSETDPDSVLDATYKAIECIRQ